MHLRARSSGLAVLVALLLGAPTVAAAATTTVYAGPPAKLVKQVATQLGARQVKKYNPDFNAFFTEHATIHVGDSVSFQNSGFHTIDIPAAGGSDLPFILPGAPVSGVKDAAGNPFWFNGRPSLGFNPALFAPSGGLTYNGDARVDSGLPHGSGPPAPFVVKFTKTGTYRYFCDIHPGMDGVLTVKASHAAIPTARQAHRALVRQVTVDVLRAVATLRTRLPRRTVSLGLTAPGGVELYSMFPAKLTVRRGTVVTFRMSADTRETHTATFGPAAVLTTLSNSIGPGFPAEAAYPSGPTQPVIETLTAHGNGFANTGALDRDPTTPNPASSAIRFNQRGVYHFICVIHSNMKGTITVT